MPYTHTNKFEHTSTNRYSRPRVPNSPHIYHRPCSVASGRCKIIYGLFCWQWCCCKAGNLFWEIATGICALFKLSCKMALPAQQPQTSHNAQPHVRTVLGSDLRATVKMSTRSTKPALTSTTFLTSCCLSSHSSILSNQ